MKYEIRFAEDDLRNIFKSNIFNLTNDFKKIGIKTQKIKKQIGLEIINEIQLGFNRKSCVELLIVKVEKNAVKVIMAKIRVPYGNKGKSSGLRCITLVDLENKVCILFHVYAKNIKNDLSQKEYIAINNILIDYIHIIYKGV